MFRPQDARPGLKEIVLKGMRTSALQPSPRILALASQIPSQSRLALSPKARPSLRAPLPEARVLYFFPGPSQTALTGPRNLVD